MDDGEGLSKQLAKAGSLRQGRIQPISGRELVPDFRNRRYGGTRVGNRLVCSRKQRELLSDAVKMRQKVLEDFCHLQLLGGSLGNARVPKS